MAAPVEVTMIAYASDVSMVQPQGHAKAKRLSEGHSGLNEWLIEYVLLTAAVQDAVATGLS